MKAENFNKIYHHYWKMLVCTAYDVLKDRDLAEDVAQEVFMNLADDVIEGLDFSPRSKYYLRSAARNRAIDYYRKRKRRKEVSLEVDQGLATAGSIEEQVESKYTANEVLTTLKEYNPEWYDAIMHINVYKEPGAVAASELGISIVALRTRHHRASKWLELTFKRKKKSK